MYGVSSSSMKRPKNEPLRETCGSARGTVKGYGRHKRRGESPCDQCQEAINDYNRERRAQGATILDPDADRLRRKAKARAWATLQRRHPDEFAAILRAHMGRLLQEEGQR